MPWSGGIVSQRAEFISVVTSGRFSFKEVCRQFNINRSTGYKWVGRFNKFRSFESLKNESRRPSCTPTRTDPKVEEAIVHLRLKYPRWGARKLSVLFQERYRALKVPKERTLNRIIKRNNLLTQHSPLGKPCKRFEYEKPNDLWQMDYKGQFKMTRETYCYPLTVMDDHSRFNLVLDAHGRIDGFQVKESLVRAFREYGMPQRMLMDRGTPWYAVNDRRFHYTRLTLWLSRLGIQILHSAAYHPQTLGKNERFHRTLKYDLLENLRAQSYGEVQEAFYSFQHEYNHVRPHDALKLRRPAELYQRSLTPYPETLSPLEYPEGCVMKKVLAKGQIYYKNCYWHVHEAMAGEYVGVKEAQDAKYEIYLGRTLIKTIDSV